MSTKSVLDQELYRAADAFADDGPLACHIEGFSPRAAQREMAAAVEEALADEDALVCEAGTGTGKTFAYLVPALLSDKRVIISTGTKTLQDQLFYRDLPVVRKALKLPVSAALLKGRANYLCHYRLEEHARQGELFHDPRAAHWFEIVRAWAAQTQKGDIAEVRGVPEKSEVWPLVTSTADNCLNQECPRFDDCCLLKVRREAAKAQVLVVNHALFFADMALRDEGFGEVLPSAHAVIFDEAHQLPETAADFLSISLSGRQLVELARDSVRAGREEAGDMPQIVSGAETLEQAARDLRRAFPEDTNRAAWYKAMQSGLFTQALQKLDKDLAQLAEFLGAAGERGAELESCAARAQVLLQRLRLLGENPEDDWVRWFETYGRGFTLYLTPLNVAPYFRAFRETQRRAWIFTSATLAVGENFMHFQQQLALEEARTSRWESPFDYRANSLLYVPENLPEPNTGALYTQAVVEAALPVLAHSGGRAFLLFTSHRALQDAAEQLHAADLPYPLLVQGESPRGELLQRFRELGNAVLLGTGSFWEGVDVRGGALSCVIIDKLPFASPGDPVLEARIEYLRRRGGNPFRDHQLPQAAITLKQGAGRLIRDVSDQGLLVLCDPRLVNRSYGRLFLDSLPAMPKTRRLETVGRFFEYLAERGGV